MREGRGVKKRRGGRHRERRQTKQERRGRINKNGEGGLTKPQEDWIKNGWTREWIVTRLWHSCTRFVRLAFRLGNISYTLSLFCCLSTSCSPD